MNPQVQSNLDNLLNEQLQQVEIMNRSARQIKGAFPSPYKPESDYNEVFEKSLSSQTKLLMPNENLNLYLISGNEDDSTSLRSGGSHSSSP
jgi:hypothetical protein